MQHVEVDAAGHLGLTSNKSGALVRHLEGAHANRVVLVARNHNRHKLGAKGACRRVLAQHRVWVGVL